MDTAAEGMDAAQPPARPGGPRRYACDLCPTSAKARDPGFRQKKQLLAHKAAVHKAEHLRLRCPQPGCQRSFTCRSKLTAHLRHHEPRRCADCSSEFPNYNALRRHRAIEHRPPAVCQQCGLQVSNRSWLRRHALTHAEGAQFPCPHPGCGRAYAAMRNLTHHLRSFHEGRRHRCTVPDCSYSFCSAQRLRRHLMLHDQGRVMPKPPPPPPRPAPAPAPRTRVTGFFRDDSWSSGSESDSSVVRLLAAA